MPATRCQSPMRSGLLLLRNGSMMTKAVENSITPTNNCLNKSSVTCAASVEPMNPPTSETAHSHKLYPNGNTTRLEAKPPTADRFCARMATRAVALAAVMGMPRNVRMGTVNNEPPPPMVLRKAATKPTVVISRYSYQSMGYRTLILRTTRANAPGKKRCKYTPNNSLLPPM